MEICLQSVSLDKFLRQAKREALHQTTLEYRDTDDGVSVTRRIRITFFSGPRSFSVMWGDVVSSIAEGHRHHPSASPSHPFKRMASRTLHTVDFHRDVLLFSEEMDGVDWTPVNFPVILRDCEDAVTAMRKGMR